MTPVEAESQDADGGVGEEKTKERASALYHSWRLTVEFEHLFSAFLSLWTWLPKISRWFALQSDSLIENSIWRSCIPKCKAVPIQWNQHSTALHCTCYHLCLAQKLWQRLHQLPHLLQQILPAKAMSHPFQILMIRMSRSTRAMVLLAIPELLTIISTFKVLQDQTMKGQAQAMTVEYWQRPSLWSSWYLEIIKIVENVREAASRSQLPAFNSPVEWSLPNRQPNNINKPWFLIPKLAACICACVCLCPQASVLSRPDGKTNWGACSKLQTYLGWTSLASLTWSIERVLLVGCTTAFCRFGPETKP